MTAKPCPFCGAKARIIKRKVDSFTGKVPEWGIGCSNEACIVYLPVVPGKNLHHYVWCYRLRAEMLEAWNKRA